MKALTSWGDSNVGEYPEKVVVNPVEGSAVTEATEAPPGGNSHDAHRAHAGHQNNVHPCTKKSYWNTCKHCATDLGHGQVM